MSTILINTSVKYICSSFTNILWMKNCNCISLGYMINIL